MINEIWTIIKEFIRALFSVDFRSGSTPIMILFKTLIISTILINTIEFYKSYEKAKRELLSSNEWEVKF